MSPNEVDCSRLRQPLHLSHVTFHIENCYTIHFTFCAVAYLVAWTLMKWLVPRHAPITDL